MTQLILIAIIGILGGAAIGLQAPLASMLAKGMGLLESVFIVHLGGVVLAGLPLLVLGGGKLGKWQSVPWYALLAGVLGAAVVTSMVYMVPRIGVAAAIILILSGQLLAGTLIDHVGGLGVEVHALTLSRVIGLALVFLGVWITVRS